MSEWRVVFRAYGTFSPLFVVESRREKSLMNRNQYFHATSDDRTRSSASLGNILEEISNVVASRCRCTRTTRCVHLKNVSPLHSPSPPPFTSFHPGKGIRRLMYTFRLHLQERVLQVYALYKMQTRAAYRDTVHTAV